VVGVKEVSVTTASATLVLTMAERAHPVSAAKEGILALPLRFKVTSFNEVASLRKRRTFPDTRHGSAALPTPLKQNLSEGSSMESED
jgi:hypothetical protein